MNGVRREGDPNCRCDETAGEEHTCPFAEDVHNDPDTTCDCCASCTHECAMDI